MIINDWDQTFTVKYGHQFPRSYLCFDTEFTGSDDRNDLIVEIGHTMVEDGKIVDQLNLVLNWYNHPEVQATWLDYKLNNMRSLVGPGWRLLPHVVKGEGQDPLQVLRFYHKLFATWSKRGLPFVAQNGQSADERLLRGNFDRFLNKSFELPANGYFDTGAIFKANQIWQAQDSNLANYRLAMMPTRADTLKSYFQRVCHTRVTGVKWGLKFILEHYDLISRHGVDVNQLHNAGYDSLCLHWVMEEYRNRVLPRPAGELNAANLQQIFEEETAKYQKDRARAAAVSGKSEPEGPVRPVRTTPALSQSRRPQRRQRLI